jgi:hypothetical protein
LFGVESWKMDDGRWKMEDGRWELGVMMMEVGCCFFYKKVK